MKRGRISRLVALAVVLSMSIIAIIWHEEYSQTVALKEILGPLYNNYTVLESARGEILLFGRPAFAWHLLPKAHNVALLQGAMRSDESNLQFVLQSVSILLRKPLQTIRCNEVFTKQVGINGRDNAYILVSPGGDEVYIYLFRP